MIVSKIPTRQQYKALRVQPSVALVHEKLFYCQEMCYSQFVISAAVTTTFI